MSDLTFITLLQIRSFSRPLKQTNCFSQVKQEPRPGPGGSMGPYAGPVSLLLLPIYLVAGSFIKKQTYKILKRLLTGSSRSF